jgi:hypothetical protein
MKAIKKSDNQWQKCFNPAKHKTMPAKQQAKNKTKQNKIKKQEKRKKKERKKKRKEKRKRKKSPCAFVLILHVCSKISRAEMEQPLETNKWAHKTANTTTQQKTHTCASKAIRGNKKQAGEQKNKYKQIIVPPHPLPTQK